MTLYWSDPWNNPALPASSYIYNEEKKVAYSWNKKHWLSKSLTSSSSYIGTAAAAVWLQLRIASPLMCFGLAVFSSITLVTWRQQHPGIGLSIIERFNRKCYRWCVLHAAWLKPLWITCLVVSYFWPWLGTAGMFPLGLLHGLCVAMELHRRI